MLPATRRHQCPLCRVERDLEQPTCLDDHGQDCPEWVCTTCSSALLVGFSVEAPDVPPARRLDAA